MTTNVRTYTLYGTEAVPVTVEVDLLNRLPRVAVVGLKAHEIQETTERVRSAIVAAGFEWPRTRVVVNLTPADLRKTTGVDLAIAVGVLVASEQLPKEAAERPYYGELALDGTVRAPRGNIAVRRAAGDDLVVSVDATKSVTIAGVTHTIRNLTDVRTLKRGPVLTHREMTYDEQRTVLGIQSWADQHEAAASKVDFSEIRGNLAAVDGVVEAARTGRPLVLVGPPGCGKSMLARRLGGILAAMTDAERLDVATIHDAAGLTPEAAPFERPFRAPHHTCSVAGLVGDRLKRAGEVTLAHKGVLLLDEAADFPRAVLESVVHAYRNKRSTILDSESLPGSPSPLPADFRLVLAVSTESELGRLRLDNYKLDPIIVRLERAPAGTSFLSGDAWPSTAELRMRVNPAGGSNAVP